MIRKVHELKIFLSIVLSVALINPSAVFAGTSSKTGGVSLPEYQVGFDTLNSVKGNISDKEKEKLLKKYFSNSSKGTEKAKTFEEAIAQLKKDGYTISQDYYAVQGGYDNGAWIVGKTFEDGFWAGMTVYPFNENGDFTLDVDAIEGLFKAYKELKDNGYTISCSDLTSFYTYHSHGTSPYGAGQITTSSWTISKDGSSITMLPFDGDGKIAISLESVKATFKTEAAISQLKKDGYKVNFQYNSDTNTTYWKVSKYNVSMDVYEFDVTSIEGLFDAYKSLNDAGYSVQCSDSLNSSYLEKGKIGGGFWTISKNGDSIHIPAFNDEGKIDVTLSKVNKLFTAKTEQAKFEKAKAQLEKDGYRVIQDYYNKDAWVVEKKINGTTTCLTVFPFDKNGKSTINVQQIEGLFASYGKLKKAGYSVSCSGKTDLYYYFSIGKSQYFEQITTGTWTIKKDGQTLKLNSVDNNKAAINVSNVNRAFSMVKELNGKKSSGYKYTAKLSGSNIIISRTKGGKTQSFKLDLNNNFGNQVLSKYNTATKIISNFTKVKTATKTYNALLTAISKLKTSINTNVSKLKSNNITKSVLSNIKNRQKTISSLVSQISSKINSLKGFFNNTTYNSLKSLAKNLTSKAKTLSTKVSSLSTKTVKTQKTNITNLYNSLKKMLTNNLDTLI